MGIPSEYDDNVERKNTHPLLLPKAGAEVMIFKQDIEVLKRAISSTDNQEHTKSVKSKLMLSLVNSFPDESACMRE